MGSSAGPRQSVRANLVFSIDAADFPNSAMPLGGGDTNGVTQGMRSNINGLILQFINGLKIEGRDFYTAFAIDYPESSYGGDAASRDGITPGYNVRSGGKTFDFGRALNYAVWDRASEAWVWFATYDSYVGTAAVDSFVADYTQKVAQYPSAIHIVAGSHRDSYHTEAQYNILRDLGAPNNVNSIIGFSSPEWILVGKPGLSPGNAYGWAFQNYTTNPDQVAHLNFSIPRRSSVPRLEFDGTNDYFNANSYASTIIPPGYQITIEVVNFGDEIRSSSIIAGSHDGSSQSFNIHLPWGDGNIYWDCGHPFNRNYKYAGNDVLGWHHWVFTKNVGTGVMNIYRDGTIWSTNSGQTSPIPTYTSMVIGAYTNNGSSINYYHKGKIAVFNTYNKELSAQDVANNYANYRTRFNLP